MRLISLRLKRHCYEDGLDRAPPPVKQFGERIHGPITFRSRRRPPLLDLRQALHNPAHLKDPINRYFTDFLVMADDPELRRYRVSKWFIHQVRRTGAEG
jgi:hypothetical protein